MCVNEENKVGYGVIIEILVRRLVFGVGIASESGGYVKWKNNREVRK
jgi:hypothetical protein